MEEFLIKYIGKILEYTKSTCNLILLSRASTIRTLQDRTDVTLFSAFSVIFSGAVFFFVFSELELPEITLAYTTISVGALSLMTVLITYSSLAITFKFIPEDINDPICWRASIILTNLAFVTLSISLLFYLGTIELIFSFDVNNLVDLPYLMNGEIGWIEWVTFAIVISWLLYITTAYSKYSRWIAQIHSIKKYQKFYLIGVLASFAVTPLAIPLMAAFLLMMGFDFAELVAYTSEVLRIIRD